MDELELSFTSEEQQCVQVAVHNDDIVETNEDFNVHIFPGIGPNIVVNTFADKVIVIIEDSSSELIYHKREYYSSIKVSSCTDQIFKHNNIYIYSYIYIPASNGKQN